MPLYLLQASYTGDGWKAQVANPQDAISRLRGTIEGLGGRIESAYYTFGDDDVVAIIEFPDNITAASFSVAGSAGGAVKSIKTTPLMTMAEGVQVMQKAAGAGYRPPGS